MTWLRVGPQTRGPLHNHGLSAHLLPTKIQAQWSLASSLLRFFLVASNFQPKNGWCDGVDTAAEEKLAFSPS